MNNLINEGKLLRQIDKNNDSVEKFRLQIKHYLICSLVFTLFALACSRLVLNNISDPNLANRLSDRLSMFHVVALHSISLSMFFTTICRKED